MRSVNIQTKKSQGDQTRTLFRFQWLLFALVFAGAALQISPSAAAHDGGPVDPTLILPAGETSFILGSAPPDTILVRLVYKREVAEPEVTLFYFLIEPVGTDHAAALEPDLPPEAVIVLFTGGSGRLRFTNTNRRLGLRTANFLVRQRWAFAAAGPFVVAVIDAARDFVTNAPPGTCSTGVGLRGCRLSTAHMIDVANVVQDLKDKFGLPVWLVGTSRGTISAASAAARLTNIDPANGDGLVLTSTLTDDPDAHEDVFDLDAQLDEIDVPTLIASHKDDGCIRTPPGDRFALAAKLVVAPKVKVRLFGGGHGAIADKCDALSPHGFFGIEAKVIKKIAKFINDNI